MPAMLLFAVVGDNIVSEPRNIVLTIVIYGVFMGLALYSYRLWDKRRILKGT
jgi:ACR3 family arsenite efflux pump ArsB